MIVRPDGPTTYEQLRREFRWDLPERFNIGTACADAHPPSDVAVVEVDDRGATPRTFGELAEASARWANALDGLGVARGDRVGIVLGQGFQTAAVHLGTYKRGAIAVPMTKLFGPDALRFRIGDSGARVVVTDSSALDKVAVVAQEVGDVTVVVAGADADDVPAPHRSLDDLLAAAATRAPVPPTTPDSPALIIYTSGTTGNPKGALHGHRVLFGHLPGFELMFEFFPQPGDRMWTPADWAWIGGLLDAALPSWFHGRPVVATGGGKFDPEWAVRLMAAHEVRNAFLPPTALKLMRQAEVAGPGLALRSVMSGGEPLGAEMLAWGREILGVTINEIFGQTEANLLVGNCAAVWPVRAGSMGRPYPGHEVAVLGGDGALVGPGQDGEIVARAGDPVMLLEYWGNPGATAGKYTEVTEADGTRSRWLLTGDVGRVDEEGYFWFDARGDDVIISAGYRIGPAEIEECILGHPAVAMVAVVGIPDEVRGSVVKAFVQLVDGQAPGDGLREAIQARVRERLAAYEYPRAIEFVDQLPLTTTGKIRRKDLRDLEQQRAAGAGPAPPAQP